MKTGVEGKLDLEEMGKHFIEMAQKLSPPFPSKKKSICFSFGRIKEKPVGDVGVSRCFIRWTLKILRFFWTEVDGFLWYSVGPLLVIDGGRSLLNGIINEELGVYRGYSSSSN